MGSSVKKACARGRCKFERPGAGYSGRGKYALLPPQRDLEKDNDPVSSMANAIPEGAVPFREGTFPSLIDFLLTLRCQLKCPQCWARNFYTQKEISKYGTKEPSFEEILRTIDLLAETGIEGIFFSGGEPTITPRFDEICAYVKAKGMKVFFSTNGLQFKKAGDKLFIEIYKEDRQTAYLVPLEKFISNVDQVCFSLDTVDPNSFRGAAPLLCRSNN